MFVYTLQDTTYPCPWIRSYVLQTHWNFKLIANNTYENFLQVVFNQTRLMSSIFCQCKNCFLSKFLNIQCQKMIHLKCILFCIFDKIEESWISIHRRSALPEYQLPQHCWGLLAHKVHFALHWLYHPVKFVTGHDHVDGYLTRNVYDLGFL